jgi:hypothetical protein
MQRGAKALSHALYLPRRKERAAQIVRRNNYQFLQPQNLELLLEENIASRTKHEWSALQSAFTAPKFSATVGDALMSLTFLLVQIQVLYRSLKERDRHKYIFHNQKISPPWPQPQTLIFAGIVLLCNPPCSAFHQ